MPCLSNVSSNSTFTFYLQSILGCGFGLSTSSNVGGWMKMNEVKNPNPDEKPKPHPSYAPTPPIFNNLIINPTNTSISPSSPETKHDPSSAPSSQITNTNNITINSNPTPTTNWGVYLGGITIIIAGYACLCNSGGCCRKSGVRKIIKSLRKRFRKVRKMSYY